MSYSGARMKGTPQSVREKLLVRSSSVDWAQASGHVGQSRAKLVGYAASNWSPPTRTGRSPPLGLQQKSPPLSLQKKSPPGVRRSPPRMEQPRKRSLSRTVSSSTFYPQVQNTSLDCPAVDPDARRHLLPSASSPSSSSHKGRQVKEKQPVRKTLSDSLSVEQMRQIEDKEDTFHCSSRRLQELQLDSEAGVGTASGVSSSCPNLIDDDKVIMKTRISNSRSSDGMNYRSGPSSAGSERPPANVLRVPNIFVTSFTHSSDIKASDHSTDKGGQKRDSSRKVPVLNAGIGAKRSYRHSAPELSVTPSPSRSYWERLRETIKPSLRKCPSDSSPNRFKTTPNQEAALEAAKTCRLVRSEPRIARVLSYLYIGNLEMSYDQRQLCRIGIRSIIDVSDVSPEDVPDNHKIHAPCMCSQEERHLKATLRIGLKDTDIADIDSSFEQINKFIEGARNVNKKILVVCWTGNSASALAVMQYLMVHHGCNLRRAYSMVMRQGSDIELSPTHQLLLQALERKLLPTKEQSRCFDHDQTLKPDSTRLPREAWTTDESDV